MAILACSLAAMCPCGLALDPSLDINQYAHNAWTIRGGFFKSTIYSIAQTPDGYLCLGTETGLLRFDGVRPVPWTPPGAERLPDEFINKLLVGSNGTLWIGTRSGLAGWNGAKMTRYLELDGQAVSSLLEDRESTVWVGLNGPSGRLCAIETAKMKCFGQDGALASGVESLYADGTGGLWAGAGTGLWHWKPGHPQLYPTPDSTRLLVIADLNRTEEGQVLLATSDGMKQLVRGGLQPYPIPGVVKLPTLRLLRDRDDGLWIGTIGRGLVHVHHGRTDVFSRSDGLSGDTIESLFEDREGSVWVATNGGLDRFREFAVSAISVNQGLSSDTPWSVLAARDGSVWVGSRSGLNRWNNGRIQILRKANGLPGDPPESLFDDRAGRIWLFTKQGLGYLEDGAFVAASGVPGGQVHAITSDGAGGLWLSENRNLLHVAAGRVIEQIPWSQLGATEDAMVLQPDVDPGGLWVAFRLGQGLIYLKDGQIRQSFRAADGLGKGAVAGLKLDRDGALWAATVGGLSLIKKGRVTTLTSQNGLPCDQVHWVMDDDNGSTWLYTACGLARLDRAELEAWKAGSKRAVHPTLFDSLDGVTLHSYEYSGYSPRATKSPDGRLWFVTGAGVQVVDPRHLPVNKLPPPVHIEQIIADRKVISNGRLPALTRDLQIDYTALSFVAPEKVRFKYELEGKDKDWQDAGTRRQAFYNDLPPRHYRFHVIASNNSGVWNETGDTLEFSIAPAWNQTTWFYGSCVAAFVAMLWGLYRLRMYQISREFSAQLEGRVEERLHVARELHDTLLQSFHGLLPRFQAVYNLLPGRVADAKQVLETALEDAGKAITEARDAVQGMRSSAAVTNDLPKALELFGAELAAQNTNGDGAATNGNAATFSAEVEGTPQDLQPILRDEIYRIAAEALRNAFHHARARRIEVEVRYGPRDFRVRVRDDGAGIDPAILGQEGRAGHFGMKGMRERAQHIGGKLEVWSERGAGTEVELTIPAAIAYGRKGARRAGVS